MPRRDLSAPYGSVEEVRGVASSRVRDYEPDLRYRLDVVAANVADVVTYAGGWVFDRVMAGWDVTVLVAGQEDFRPIRILGADIVDLEGALETWAERPRPHTLAVCMDLLESDWRIRRGVLEALDHATEVRLWGDNWSTELNHTVDSVEHRLSAAARAFKAQALWALELPAPAVNSCEIFRNGMTNWLCVLADPIPAS